MSLAIKSTFQKIWQPQLITLRHKSKIRITKPKPPHFERAVIEAVAVPYFIHKKRPSHIPNYDLCGSENVDKTFDLNPYEAFLVKTAKKWFTTANLIAFFHVDFLEKEDLFQNKLELKKIGMKYFVDNQKVMKNALHGTKYEPVIVLYQSVTAYAVGIDVSLSQLLEVTKKLSKIHLMAAIYENRLLSMSEVNYYGQIKNIEEARVKLVSVLNLASQNLVQQLQQHPSNLVQLLNTHQEELKKTNKTC